MDFNDTPEEAAFIYQQSHGKTKLHPDECLEMRFFEHRTTRYWKQHPGEKLKLMRLSAQLLWQPSVFETSGLTTRLEVHTSREEAISA